MAEWLEKVSGWWASRSSQERRTLKFALPIIASMLVYLVLIEPVISIYSARKAEYEQAQETLTWLYDQASLVGRMQNSCGNRISYLQGNDDPQALAQTIAGRSNVSVRAETRPGSESLSMTVSSAPGNRLLNYVQSLACNGFDVSELEIKRADATTATVSASLSISPAVLPRQYQ